MKKKRDADLYTNMVAVLIVMLVLLIVIDYAKDSYAGETLVYVSHTPEKPKLGDIVSVEIKISNVKKLVGFQIDLSYNDGVLTYIDYQRGDMFPELNSFWVTPKRFPGLVDDLAATTLGGKSVSGSGTIVKLKFLVSGYGVSPVKLQNVKLINSDIEEIEIQTGHDIITVRSGI